MVFHCSHKSLSNHDRTLKTLLVFTESIREQAMRQHVTA